MDYTNKKVAITGASGFLGGHLAAWLEEQAGYVWRLTGDVRRPETFAGLDHTYDYLFHFGAPSSQVLFSRSPAHCAAVTIEGFINAMHVCDDHGIKLVYPSTGLLSSGRFNEYAMCKKICEDMSAGRDALGIRLFATYGSGEGHKRDYASVPYLFIRDVMDGRRPVVFGDGKQVRDFIHIDDAVPAILELAERCNDPVIDLGSGVSTSFNRILELISIALPTPKEMGPVYIDKPAGYVDETAADVSKLHEFYKPVVRIAEGIRRTIADEKSNRNDHN